MPASKKKTGSSASTPAAAGPALSPDGPPVPSGPVLLTTGNGWELLRRPAASGAPAGEPETGRGSASRRRGATGGLAAEEGTESPGSPEETAGSRDAGRGGPGSAGERNGESLPDFLQEHGDWEVLDQGEVRPAPGRRSAGTAAVEGAEAGSAGGSAVPLVAEVPEDSVVLLVVRQASGALSFHPPRQTLAGSGRRRSARGGEEAGGAGAAAGAAAGRVRVSFEVPVEPGNAATGTGRRGFFSNLVRVTLLKVKDVLLDKLVEEAAELAVPFLARKLEEHLWRNRKQGWLRVDPAALAADTDRLAPGRPSFARPARGLLLIHGTFSDTHGGFRRLTETDFFRETRTLYEGNVFAFNHFTISKTPAENVREMLDALPDGEFEFDIITHSRGGLVARELMEGTGLDHPNRRRLRIGKVIMVACPSQGTPLGGVDHWDRKLSFMANLLEMLPDNPFSMAGAWLAEALKWFAANVLVNCGGLVAMDPAGEFVQQLQEPPDAPDGTLYHALVSNFQPPRQWWARLGDMGIDTFFEGANDLVVPTEGGWRTADLPAAWIPAERVGCFGPGGNLTAAAEVNHVNFFGQKETAAFLTACLKGENPAWPAQDTGAALPSRRLRGIRATAGGVRDAEDGDRGPKPRSVAVLPATETPSAPVTAAAAAAATAAKVALKEVLHEMSGGITGWDEEDTLYLTIISSTRAENFDRNMPSSLLLAQYGSARVVEPFYTRNIRESEEEKDSPDKAVEGKTLVTNEAVWTEQDLQNAGSRFHDIIAMQQFMVNHTNGKPQKPYTEKGATFYFTEPDTDFLRLLGDRLFRVLFQGQVRRLYDAVLYRHKRKRVNIIFTSMLPWVSDLPWEFARDQEGGGFLVTGNVRFVRNVLSAVPVDKIERNRPKLRILVASAQAAGASVISDEAETQRIRDSFRSLIEAGLVEVEVMARCTPEALHKRLWATTEEGEFDVLHFIGHGRYDSEAGGMLEFENEFGYAREIEARDLTNIVKCRGIRVVFLNACETGRGFSSSAAGRSAASGKRGRGKGEKAMATNYNKGVAIELTREGIPAVVANQYSVVDQLASLFSLHFYSCLAHGLTLADAMREARIAVSYAEDAEPMDWGVPVLFAKNPNATICARRPWTPPAPGEDPGRFAAPVAGETGAQGAGGAKGTAGRRLAGGGPMRRITADLLARRDLKVAVWCASHALSYRERLADMLREFTLMQREVEFRLSKRRLPAWIFDQDKKRGYLYAPDIVQRMERMRTEVFGADFLFCLTDLPVMAGEGEKEDLYYFSHQQDGGAGRVILFSTWGFEPPLTGGVFRQALANHLAVGLLDGLTGAGCGAESFSPPEDYPIHTTGYFNDQRSVEHLAGRMTITPGDQRVIDRLIAEAERRKEAGEGKPDDLTRERFQAIQELLKVAEPAG